MYFLFVFFVVILYFIIYGGKGSEAVKQKRFCFCAFLVLLFIYFFKDDSILPDLRRDGGGYMLEFDNIRDISTLRDFFISYFFIGGYFHEIGWSLLNFIISRFTDDFTVFQKIVGFVICAGYSYGIYKLSRSPLFSFLFIMLYATAFFQSFYVLRQHLATASLFFFIPAVVNKQHLKVFIGIVLAISLHYSAAILLPFYFFYLMGNKLFSLPRIAYVILLIFGFAFVLNHMTFERYEDNATEELSNALGFILTGGVLLVFIIASKLSIKQRVVERYDAFIETYMFYGAAICFACMGSSTGRLTNYFTLFLAISVPYSVRNLNKPIRLLAYSLFLAYCLIRAMGDDRGIFQYQLAF